MHLGHEGITMCTGRGTPISDSLTKRTKRIFNLGILDRSSGSTSHSYLHDQVEDGEVPLPLCRPLYCMEGMSVFRLWHEHDEGWWGCTDCRVQCELCCCLGSAKSLVFTGMGVLWDACWASSVLWASCGLMLSGL